MWCSIGVVHQLVIPILKKMTKGLTDHLLKAGKIVKQFIILILMLLGKAYYDIQS